MPATTLRPPAALLRARMRHAALCATLLVSLLLLRGLQAHRSWHDALEWAWALLLAALLLDLLVAQHRIPASACPACGAPIAQGLWHFPGPFALFRRRCRSCGEPLV